MRYIVTRSFTLIEMVIVRPEYDPMVLRELVGGFHSASPSYIPS